MSPTPSHPGISLSTHTAPLALLALLFLLATPAHPQGCTQCRDNTAATPPATQRAYRHAIELLALTATGLCAATVFVVRRNR